MKTHSKTKKETKNYFDFKNFIIIIFITMSSLILISLILGTLFKIREVHNFELVIFFNILTITLSVIFLYMAFYKLQDILDQSKINNTRQKLNYLLQVDERWTSSEIIQAREVIHKLYLQASSDKHNSDEKIQAIIGASILKMENNPKEIREFILLLNFMDFLETIGFLWYTESISINEINELLGNSIKYFYKIFEKYIHHRREKDILFYKRFSELYEECTKTYYSDISEGS